MNTNLLLQATSLIFVFVSLLLAFFLFTVKSENRTGNALLATYLILSAIDTSSYFYHNYIDLGPTLEMLRIELGSFLKLPFLFLFILSVLYSDFRLKLKHLLHLIPLLLMTIVLLPRFYLVDYQDKIAFFMDHFRSFEGIFSTVLAHLQFLFYIVAVFVLLHRYKKILVENYSISDKSNYKWVFQLNLILCGLLVVAVLKNVYRYGDYGEWMTAFRLGMAVALLLFICWLFLKALYAPRIFSGIDSKLQLVSDFTADSKYASTLSENRTNEKQRQIDQLKEYMIKEAPYLDSTLTIQDLAGQLDMDIRELSLLINHYINQHFYDFINHYRIKKAKEILKNPQKRELTILEVLYQVGYNSKSSFYTSFKKETGLTPTDFRKKYCK